jgi:nucleoside transporter
MVTSGASVGAQAGKPFLSLRLSAMMFLQYAVWGIWLPYLANYLTGSVEKGGLGFTGAQVGWILGLAGAAGALVAPFVAGQVADRFLNAEKALGIFLILGGVIKFGTYYATGFGPFLALSIAYSILYMPTIALTNSICFANLDDAERRFPRIRVWGTIGWIIASTLFPLIWLQYDIRLVPTPWFLDGTLVADATHRMADALRVSGVLSVGYGIYAMTLLPRTPPKPSAKNPIAVFEAFRLLRIPSVLVLTVAALLISMIHNVYFIRTGPWLEAIGFAPSKIGATMSVGQMVEIGTLAVLGGFLARFGYRTVLVIGCLAYFLRFADFAVATDARWWLAYAGIALHGFCFAFFFAASFLYVDRVAPADARHSAQTAYGIAILGIGPILSGFFNGWLDQVAAPAGQEVGALAQAWREVLIGLHVPITEGTNWGAMWWTLAAVGLAAFALMLVGFWDRSVARTAR